MIYSTSLIVLLLFLHLNMENIVLSFYVYDNTILNKFKNILLLLNGILAYSVFTHISYVNVLSLLFVSFYSLFLFSKLKSFKLKECYK
jgi:hypothetical protein